jgi:predicted nucleic acid-binding protein
VTLLDANVLVAGLDRSAAGHSAARSVVIAARKRVLPGVLVPQVLLEAYAVLTDRKRVASPLSPEVAWSEVGGLALEIPVIYPHRQTLEEFGRTMSRHGPKAQVAFDAFLVAQMRAAGIGTICTYNVRDFTDYRGITPETPDATRARFGLTP